MSPNGDGFVTPHFRVPKVSGFRFGADLVVAMETVKGVCKYTQNGAVKGRLDLYHIGRFTDMHGGNYFVDGSVVVPVDMASPRGRKYGDIRVLDGTIHYEKEWNRRYGAY
jgi:hypothetical protein